MISKIFRSTLLVAAVILLCSLGIIMGVLYEYSNDIQVTQLKDELRLAAGGTEESGVEFLHRVGSQRFRLTWVGADGGVIFDTHAEADQILDPSQWESKAYLTIGSIPRAALFWSCCTRIDKSPNK